MTGGKVKPGQELRRSWRSSRKSKLSAAGPETGRVVPRLGWLSESRFVHVPRESDPIRIGFDVDTIEHRGLSVESLLDFATEHSLDGVQFLTPGRITQDLSVKRLEEARKLAGAKNLSLEVGLPWLNPSRRSRIEGGEISIDEQAGDLIVQILAVAALGCGHARIYLGDRHDRFRTDIRWIDQLDASLRVLKLLEPALRDYQVALAIETHADVTSGEIQRFLDAFTPEVVGVTLDTGNLPMRLVPRPSEM